MSSDGAHPSPHSIGPAVARHDDVVLVHRVQVGEPAAFELLVRTWARPLIGFATSLLHSADDAEEVAQDLFVWIWEHRFEWEVRGALGPYLFRAIRNRAVSRLRRRQVDQRFQERLVQAAPRAEPGARSPTEHGIAADELSAAIDRAIAGLSDRCREVFLLSRQQGLSYSEIAETLQISPKTVEIHMARALNSLRQALAPWRID